MWVLWGQWPSCFIPGQRRKTLWYLSRQEVWFKMLIRARRIQVGRRVCGQGVKGQWAKEGTVHHSQGKDVGRWRGRIRRGLCLLLLPCGLYLPHWNCTMSEFESRELQAAHTQENTDAPQSIKAPPGLGGLWTAAPHVFMWWLCGPAGPWQACCFQKVSARNPISPFVSLGWRG